MKRIGSEDARRKFRDLLDDAQAGESAEITRNGKPVAVLVPIGWYRNAQGVGKGVYAFTHDTDGNRLPGESELPVGELMSAIGEAAIGELEKS
jgi:prevent-host-death family protein